MERMACMEEAPLFSVSLGRCRRVLGSDLGCERSLGGSLSGSRGAFRAKLMVRFGFGEGPCYRSQFCGMSLAKTLFLDWWSNGLVWLSGS